MMVKPKGKVENEGVGHDDIDDIDMSHSSYIVYRIRKVCLDNWI